MSSFSFETVLHCVFVRSHATPTSFTKNFIKNNRGQTMVEYLLLVLFAALTGFFVLNYGALPEFTKKMLNDLTGAMQSITRNAEMESAPLPSDPQRFKAVHHD